MSSHDRPVRVTVDELETTVEREPVVLAAFYTRSCPKCDAQEPILGLVARAFDGVVAMVDPGDDLAAFRAYDVASAPGFVLFRDGEPVDRLADGVIGAERLLSFARAGTE